MVDERALRMARGYITVSTDTRGNFDMARHWRSSRAMLTYDADVRGVHLYILYDIPADERDMMTSVRLHNVRCASSEIRCRRSTACAPASLSEPVGAVV